MKIINWGMIGAGDVTEVKSGPAFKKVPNSDLIAVMRRDEAKVKDYATRHDIAQWFTDADQLLANADVDAIYIATPPHVHILYVEKALRAGKMVYVEKPLALDTKEALEMQRLVEQYQGKLVVAHYRRAMPYFVKVHELVNNGAIGNISLINLKLYKQRITINNLTPGKENWREDSAISGGGLFHDLAPHQIDLLTAIFGHPLAFEGLSNTKGSDKPAIRVAGQMLFAENILFNGVWDFDRTEKVDICEIAGDKGSIQFSFFENNPIVLKTKEGVREFVFEPLSHVQQPMIDQTVQYFLDKGDNPCAIEEGVMCMKVIDAFTK